VRVFSKGWHAKGEQKSGFKSFGSKVGVHIYSSQNKGKTVRRDGLCSGLVGKGRKFDYVSGGKKSRLRVTNPEKM